MYAAFWRALTWMRGCIVDWAGQSFWGGRLSNTALGRDAKCKGAQQDNGAAPARLTLGRGLWGPSVIHSVTDGGPQTCHSPPIDPGGANLPTAHQ